MSRPKKDERPKEMATLMISVEDFMRTRDSVVTGLTTLQSAIDHLLRAYIAHTSSILGGGGSSVGFDTIAISNPLATSADVGSAPTAAAGAGASAELVTTPGPSDVKPKKKRTKKERDPNAPPRPLTAYFLFAKHAKTVIKSDLGEEAKPGEIAAEATRRWNAMPEPEKAMWKQSYRKSLAEWYERMKEYEASIGGATAGHADELDVDDGLGHVDVVINMGEEDSDAEGDDVNEARAVPAAPAKAPAPAKEAGSKQTAKRKRGKPGAENGQNSVAVIGPASSPAAEAHPAPKQTRVPVPGSSLPPESTSDHKGKGKEKRKNKDSKEASAEEPKKKRSRKSTAAEEVEQPAAVVDAVRSPEKKEKRSRARKSDMSRA